VADYVDDIDRAQARDLKINAIEVSTAVARIRTAAQAEGCDDCEGCGDLITEARRRAVPSARRCAPCQAVLERRAYLGKGA